MDENLYVVVPSRGISHCDDVKYDPNKPRIKSLLWDNYDWFVEMDKAGKARPCVLDNVQKVLLCNTCYMGFDLFECPNCGNEMVFNRKCHSRFCTSCGVKYQKTLAIKAETMCVDTPHRHMVFTIPEEYRPILRKYRKALDLLFVAARNTICKVTNENLYRKEKRKRRKTGKIRNDKDNYYLYRNFKCAKDFGMIASIHTFGRDLKWNPHIHALVAEMVYDPVKGCTKSHHYFDFASLRKTWQYELNRLMLDYFGNSFRPYMNRSYIDQDKGFYVYARYNKEDQNPDSNKNYSKDIAGCVSYMMRYASRPAMAESRLVSYDKKSGIVHWFYNDHKTEKREDVKEPARKLLERMIIHIPDEQFRTVRYYGFYHPKKKRTLEKIYELMGKQKKASRDKRKREQERKQKLRRIRFRTSVCDTFNRDVLLCKCGHYLKYSETYNPLEGKTNDREYRQECINEMHKMQIPRIPPGGGAPANPKYVSNEA